MAIHVTHAHARAHKTRTGCWLDAADVDRLDEAMQAVVTDLGLDIEGDAVRQLVAFHVRRVIGRPAPLERPEAPTVPDGPPPAPAEF